MMKYNKKSGFSLTMVAILMAIIVVTFSASLFSIMFFTKNLSRIDSLKQQAYYNANSGVEYARFILGHSAVYDPLLPAGGSGHLVWPKGTSFQCFVSDATKGTVMVAIASDGGTGFNITSTGTVNGVTAAINRVNWLAGKITAWR